MSAIDITVTVRGVQGSGKTTIARLVEESLQKAGIGVFNDAAFEYGKCKDMPLEQCVESFKKRDSAVRLNIERIKPPPLDCFKYVLHRVEQPLKKIEARSPHWDVTIGDGRVAMIQGLLMHHIVRRGEILYLRAEEIKVGDQIFLTRDCIRNTCEN